MIIFGVDPGTINTGYGIIKYSKNEFHHITSGIIKPNPKFDLPAKLEHIYNVLYNLLKKNKPDSFVIETAFYGKNIQSAMKIGYVRGVSLLAAIHNNVETSEYSPREIKKSVTGNGAGSKEQVKFMVKKLLYLKKKMKFDESDALAIAICHALKTKSLSNKSSSWKEYIKANPDKVLK